MSKSKGYRSKTRKLLRKKTRERGLPPLGRLLRRYTVGEKVVIKIDPSIHKGMPHRRFHGKVGTILEQRGRAYYVAMKIGGKTKKVLVRPEHIAPCQ
jgi:large subunit ribosomal protein L21e